MQKLRCILLQIKIILNAIIICSNYGQIAQETIKNKSSSKKNATRMGGKGMIKESAGEGPARLTVRRIFPGHFVKIWPETLTKRFPAELAERLSDVLYQR